MRTFITVLNNNYRRTLPRIGAMLAITFLSLASMVLAVYMSNKQQVFSNIAVIGQVAEGSFEDASQVLHITFLETEPPVSDLYEQKYDAYVTMSTSGTYDITSLKSDTYKDTLLALLENPDTKLPANYSPRGSGENIIGFLMMFLLMISFGNIFAFADDKEQGQMRRVFAAPSSFGWYISAHIVYSLSMFFPQFLLIVILKSLSISVGFSIPQYLGMIILIGFLGSSFALLLNTLIKKPDNANMLGNSVTVLSSILAGSFYSFTKENKLIDGFIGLIPQKQIMNIASDIGNTSFHTVGSMIYVIVFSLLMFLSSCIILNTKYVKKS